MDGVKEVENRYYIPKIDHFEYIVLTFSNLNFNCY